MEILSLPLNAFLMPNMIIQCKTQFSAHFDMYNTLPVF